MKAYLLALIMVSLAAAGALTPNAVELTSQNYSQFKANNRILFVEYFKPTCGYCLRMAPKIDALGKHFKQVAGVQVGTVNIDEEKKIASQEYINVYPTMKVFIKGEAIDYKGKHTTEAMIDFIMELHMARLLVVPKITDARPPAVIVSGVDSNSNLQALPALFPRYPIYYTQEIQQFTVRIIKKDDSTIHYKGAPKIAFIAEWLELEAAPVLVDLGSSIMSLKLEKAMEKQWPILAFFDRTNDKFKNISKNVLALMEEYCQGIDNFICGFANKGSEDYENLNSILDDPNPEGNRIAWINIQSQLVYLLEQPLENLSKEHLSEFTQRVQANKIKAHRNYGKSRTPEVESSVEDEL